MDGGEMDDYDAVEMFVVMLYMSTTGTISVYAALAHADSRC